MLDSHLHIKICGFTNPPNFYNMNTISYYLGISKQTEVLLLVLAGICCTIFDASLFNLHTNLYKVWNMPMDPTKFTDTAQLYVKYILSSIVLVRTFTVHLYLAFYIVMLWPAIFEEKPGLLIPWLIVGAVKCLATGAMSFSTGLYICLTYRFSKAVCWDFMMTQLIDQGPSIYMWFCVLSYYYDLKRDALEIRCDRQTPSIVFGLAERRRKVRSLIPDTKLRHTFDDERQLISVSTIDTIINQLNLNLRKETSRSLDSLLCRIAAEAEKEEIFDTKYDMLEDDKDLSFAERTLRTLNISPSYVIDAKMRKDHPTPIQVEGKDLKVESTPLPVTKSPSGLPKPKKLDVKVTPVNSDDISLILSEKELTSLDITEGEQKRLPGTPPNSFMDTNLATEIQKLFVNKSDMEDLELKEIHVPNFDDNLSEYSKTECLEMENSVNDLDRNVSKEKETVKSAYAESQSSEKPAVQCLAHTLSEFYKCKGMKIQNSNNSLGKSFSKPKENIKHTCRANNYIKKSITECLAQKNLTASKFEQNANNNVIEDICKQKQGAKSTNVGNGNIKKPAVECLPQDIRGCSKTGDTKSKISNNYLSNNSSAKKISKNTCSVNHYIERLDIECLAQNTVAANFSKPTIEIIDTNNEETAEPKGKINEKMCSISKTSTNVTDPPPSAWKSKSQGANQSCLPPSTFKYDGYTLAYIESERRKAAVEIIKNRKRRSSSDR